MSFNPYEAPLKDGDLVIGTAGVLMVVDPNFGNNIKVQYLKQQDRFIDPYARAWTFTEPDETKAVVREAVAGPVDKLGIVLGGTLGGPDKIVLHYHMDCSDLPRNPNAGQGYRWTLLVRYFDYARNHLGWAAWGDFGPLLSEKGSWVELPAFRPKTDYFA